MLFFVFVYHMDGKAFKRRLACSIALTIKFVPHLCIQYNYNYVLDVGGPSLTNRENFYKS